MSSGLIWFDISTSRAWRGKPVGIVRTENKIAQEFLKMELQNLRFCYFDKQTKSYCEVPAAEARGLLESANTQEPTAATQPPSLQATAKRLAKRVVANSVLRLPHHVQRPLKDAIKAQITTLRLLKTALAVRHGHSQIALPQELPPRPIFGDGDAYISMGLDWDNNDLKSLWRYKQQCRLRVFLFCYDLIPIYCPQYVVPGYGQMFSEYFGNLLWCADHVFAISHESKRQLLRFIEETNSPRPQVEVVQLGADIGTRQISTTSVTQRFRPRSFVLTVGTIEVRKNHRLLFQLWHRLAQDRELEELPPLIVVGRIGWRVSDLLGELQDNFLIREKVHLLSDISDAELAWLYENCLFTVFPSFYEGWGLPVVESLSHGKVCIASNTSAIPEAGQDLACLLDPYDFPSWLSTLRMFFKNHNLLSEKENHIREHFRPLEWKGTAKAILNTIENSQHHD